MKIEIDMETVDGIVLAALKRHLKILRKPMWIPKNRNAEDVAAEKRVIAAHKVLIDYYGPR